MPGFDGTGPRGNGPMSGRGGGFCLVNIPDDPSKVKTGFAGKAGNPVQISGDLHLPEISFLHVRLKELQTALHEIRSRLSKLDAGDGTVTTGSPGPSDQRKRRPS